MCLLMVVDCIYRVMQTAPSLCRGLDGADRFRSFQNLYCRQPKTWLVTHQLSTVSVRCSQPSTLSPHELSHAAVNVVTIYFLNLPFLFYGCETQSQGNAQTDNFLHQSNHKTICIVYNRIEEY